MSKSNLLLGFHGSGMVGLVDALSDAVGNDLSLSGGLDIGCVWVNHDRVVVFQNKRFRASEVTTKASACE